MASRTTPNRLAGTWNLIAAHSSVEFSVRYSVVNWRSGFAEIDAKLEDGKLSGSGKANSILVKNDVLLRHLLTSDFLDADKHPEITFESNRIVVDGDKVELDGQLRIAGKSRPIHATGTVTGPLESAHGPQLGLALETTFDRTDFGIVYNSEMPDGTKTTANEIALSVELSFAKN